MFGAQIAKDPTATNHIVFDQVTLHYSVDGGAEWNVTGTLFPFDFSAPLPAGCRTAAFRFSGVSSSGARLSSQQYTLQVHPDAEDGWQDDDAQYFKKEKDPEGKRRKISVSSSDL